LVQTYATGGRADLPEKVGFILELPEPVNIPAGSTYFTWIGDKEDALEGITVYRQSDRDAEHCDTSGQSFVSLSVFQIEHPMSAPVTQAGDIVLKVVLGDDPTVPLPNVAPAPDAPKMHTTVVFVMTPLIECDDDNPISIMFDHCLGVTERYLRGYRQAFGAKIRPLSRQRLPFMIFYIRGSLRLSGIWDRDALGLLLLHTNVPTTYDPKIHPSGAAEKLNLVLARLSEGDPTGAFLDSWVRADYAFEREGDYAAVLIFAYQASEVLLDTVLTLLLWEEGMKPVDAANTVFHERTAKRTRSQFKGRIGGLWATEGTGIVAAWARDFAEMRHRVVHQGYQPTRDEASQALGCLRDLEQFVKGRLVQRAYKYPESALMLLGQPGLEKRNGWTRRIRQYVEDHPDMEKRVQSYARWRAEFDRLRTRV
jgi:hypothetical protein